MNTKAIKYLLGFVLALWASALSAQTHWSCDINAYQYDMTVYFELQENGVAITAENLPNYEVAAFVGDECRGIGEFKTAQVNDQPVRYGYLRVRSNAVSGETVSFKAYIKDADTEVNIDETANIPFANTQAVGFPSTPKVLNISQFKLTLADPAAKGEVTGAGNYYRGVQAKVTATPADGYVFTKWSDESTDNPHTITVNSNLTLSAVFTPIDYNIEYNLSGGTLGMASNPTKYNKETADITLNNPTREGYTFEGWSGTDIADNTPVVTIYQGSMGDRSFTALWSATSYDLKYDLQGGSLLESNPANYTIKSEAITLKNPTKPGYTFAGWTGTGLESATMAVTIAAGSTGERSYIAMWTPVTYTITYNLDGGALDGGVTNPTNYTIETPAFYLNNPKKTGKTFDGWTGTGLSKPTKQVLIEKGTMGDRSYTATWSDIIVEEYSVTAAPNQDEMGVVTGSGIYQKDQQATLTATANTGYYFVKWSDETTVNPKSVTVTSDVSLTAVFSPNQYTMTFVLGNGESNVVKTQDFASALTAPTPTRTGYTFTGWDNEVPATVPVGNKTFTAQWTINEYTITFVSNGGSSVAAITQDYATAVTAPDAPTREGYTFSGWDNPVPATMPAENVTLTAQWTINQYTMTFVLGNGEANIVKKQDYGSSLSIVAPTRAGYTFGGWDDAIPETIPASNKTFTAQWTPVIYSLSYVLNEGVMPEGVANPANYTVESEAITLNNPTKEGYTFAGWTGTDLTQATTPVTIAKGNTGDRTYTATWTVNQYTITFDSDGGSSVADIVDNYGATLTAPAAPTKMGYTFKGWTPAFPETMPLNGASLKATWEVVTYNISYVLDGGTLAQGDTNPATYTVESEAITLKNPTKEGYTFAGWTGTGLTEASKSVTIAAGSTGDRSYTATWTVNQYTITFDSDGGSSVADIVDNYGATLTAPTAPTKTGYTFKGWTPAFPETMPLNGASLKATWEVVTYNISYVLDGGTLAQGDTNPATYTVESEAITLKNPTKEGYTFAGWTGTGLTEATTPVTIAAGSTGDRSYTATWTVNTGITQLLANSKTVDVYTINGTLVGRKMTADEVQQLPKGLYIINGKKMVVK